MEINIEKVKKVLPSAPKSSALGKALEVPLTIQEVKKKKAKGEVLTLQEKRLLKQEEKQQLGEVIEKKKRLKKEVLVEDESNTYDNFNELADGITDPVNLDNMTLKHIVGNKELLPDPENDEEKKLIERFGTTDPKIIDELLKTDEYTEILDEEDTAISHTEPLSPETTEEHPMIPRPAEYRKHRSGVSSYRGMVWKRVKNWLSRKNPDAHTALSSVDRELGEDGA